ncbi:cysteine hydrolase [Burkholderia ubonensis]|uniref:cysteine hydrolase family protein n=1 Tax=Burkholderia ubonensis TaxID=101571 RepID=UPI0008FE5271|nr:isochorismatase family protein [Burkholderia ubonensis]OJA29362.1 cysteine hydrolase [Burkholderia ubonensis]OJB27925.1 cysteine hydrolase [Burkholderia ubonensis]
MSSFSLRTLTRTLVLASAAAIVPVSEAASPLPATPTVRAMAGAQPIDHIDPKSTALVVIDFQNEYLNGRMPIQDVQRAMANTQRLIKFADAHGIRVFQVQHVAPAGSPLFALDGETVKFIPQMAPRAGDTVVQKETVSVFASTDLDRRLRADDVETLLIAGLMTHACVAGAARDAVPLGYHVVVASDASATRSIVWANGATIDKDTLHRAALAEIEDTFGDVKSTAEIVALPVR